MARSPSAKEDDAFEQDEAQKRFEAALKGALKTPHKPLKEKSSVKKTKSAKKPG